MLYQCLQLHAKIEEDSEFESVDDIWNDSVMLADIQITDGMKEKFYRQVEQLYDIHLEEKVKKTIVTIGQLKQIIGSYSEVC